MQSSLRYLGAEVGVEGRDPRLIELVGSAGLAELSHHLCRRVGGLTGLLQQREPLLRGDRADIGPSNVDRQAKGRRDRAIARFLELALGDLRASRQRRNGEQVADKLEADFGEVAGTSECAAQGERGIWRQARLDILRFGDAEIVVSRL